MPFKHNRFPRGGLFVLKLYHFSFSEATYSIYFNEFFAEWINLLTRETKKYLLIENFEVKYL